MGYWHLSRPSPELLEALDKGWLRQSMRVLDLGCGLATDIGHLGSLGFSVTGVDLCAEAIGRARRRYPGIELVVADVRALPFADRSFDYLLDRDCFHYLAPGDRPRYAAEAWRVLREAGELLLRACLNNQGIRNDITPAVIETTFEGWQIVTLELRRIATDTRELEAVYARLRRAVQPGLRRREPRSSPAAPAPVRPSAPAFSG